MKMNSIKQLFFLLCFSSASLLIMAQAEPPKRLSIAGFSAHIESFDMKVAYGSGLTKMRQIVPQSNLLKEDFKDFDQTNGEGYYNYNGPSLGMFVYFNWQTRNENWSKLHPKLRFGISTYRINLMHLSLNRTQRFIVDTLVSVRDSSVYYIDSVSTKNYQFDYSAQFVFVNAQLLIGSNPANRWRIYGGIGLSIGYSINSQIDLSNYNNQVYNSQYNYNPDPRWSPNDRRESYAGGDGFAVLLSVPIGLEFRLSKSKRIWENINLYFEGTPSLAYLSFSKLGNSLNNGRTFAFGLKYELN